MSTAIMDDEARPALLRGYGEMRGDMVERADRARREGARPTIGVDSSPEDIAAGFEHAEHVEPAPMLPTDAVELPAHLVRARPRAQNRHGADGGLPFGRASRGTKLPRVRVAPQHDGHVHAMREAEAAFASAARLVSADRVRSLSDDLRAVYVEHGLLEARPITPAASAEIVTVDPAELRLWFVGTFAPRLHEKVGAKLADAGWEFRCPLATEWRDVRRPEKGKPKREPVKRPLFGTYGFLFPHDETKPDWIALDRVDGFGGLTRHSVTKVPLRALGIDVARFGRLEAEGFFDATRSRPPKVKALDRVFATVAGARLAGIVQMTMGDRVKVLLDMLGEATVPMDSVEVA